jgi:hypothetical protein
MEHKPYSYATLGIRRRRERRRRGIEGRARAAERNEAIFRVQGLNPEETINSDIRLDLFTNPADDRAR